MGFYANHVLPRLVDLGCSSKELAAERARCLAGVGGRVIEIGFGSGLNLPHYPRAVGRCVGVDPSGQAAKLARKRIAAAPFPVEVIASSAEKIAAGDHTFDAAVSTFSLCTIPDGRAALTEVRRVLAPGGRLFFLEHGRAPEDEIQRWQRRLNGIQGRLFGGCQLDRDIARLITNAGFEIEALDAHYGLGAPKPFAFLYRGVARRID
jgi:ubiquinone/menaquinone biosynthesis C-methylase UbiE